MPFHLISYQILHIILWNFTVSSNRSTQASPTTLVFFVNFQAGKNLSIFFFRYTSFDVAVPATMVHFRDLFKRAKKQTVQREEPWTSESKLSVKYSENAISPATGLNIVAVPVAGMQRSNQGTYMTTYTNTTLSQSISRNSCSDTSTTSDSSKTAVEVESISANGPSIWKGAPNGTAYDKREELTPEDEDMWANLAM